ncbi:MAG: hypothetical protein ACLQD8_01625 [Thermoplasmata archaeon]
MSLGRHARWTVPAVVAVLLVVSSGVGFAAFAGSATVEAHASAASFGLVITSVGLVGGPAYVTVQTTVLPSPLVQAWINNTPPTTLFNISVVVKNIGSVPAQNVAWVFTTTFHGPASCSVGAYGEVLEANDPPGDVLGPGASFTSYWGLHSGTLPPRCGGLVWATFTVTYTATAGV